MVTIKTLKETIANKFKTEKFVLEKVSVKLGGKMNSQSSSLL